MAPCSKTTTGAGQKRFKFPTPPRQSQIPHPRDGLSDQIPDSPGKENIQMPGVCPGGGEGMLMFLEVCKSMLYLFLIILQMFAYV